MSLEYKDGRPINQECIACLLWSGLDSLARVAEVVGFERTINSLFLDLSEAASQKAEEQTPAVLTLLLDIQQYLSAYGEEKRS